MYNNVKERNIEHLSRIIGRKGGKELCIGSSLLSV